MTAPLWLSSVPVWLFMVLMQALMSGAVVSLIVERRWLAVLVTCFTLNVLWWPLVAEHGSAH